MLNPDTMSSSLATDLAQAIIYHPVCVIDRLGKIVLHTITMSVIIGRTPVSSIPYW